MMDNLIRGVEALIQQELAYARKDHGDTFHSPHEAFGVIAEELHEASEMYSMIHENNKTMLNALRFDSPSLMDDACVGLRRAAMLTACELIQVAAMAEKAMIPDERREKHEYAPCRRSE